MMFGRWPRTEIHALRPLILIHTQKIELEYVNIENVMKLSIQKNGKNEKRIQLFKLSPIFYPEHPKFNALYTATLPNYTSNTCVSSFYYFSKDRCIVGISNFLCKPIFIVFSSMGSCSLQYVWCISFWGILWNSTCLLIHIS